MTLVRKPYPPHLNPASDAFSYVIQGNWQMDPRYPFPLPWTPTLAHKGFEDLSFAPGFDDITSPEYHSYLILGWLDGRVEPSASDLQSEMVTHFRWLAEQRGHNNNFKPDLSKVTAQYSASSNGPVTLGGAPTAKFSGSLTLIDRHGDLVSLHSEVTSSHCDAGHTAVYFAMSKEPRPGALWNQLDAVRDGFKCNR